MRKKRRKGIDLPSVNKTKNAENSDIIRKIHERLKPKKSVDKRGGGEYNSQCCREGRGREASERAGTAILENDIEKNEREKKQSDSERVKRTGFRLALKTG